MKNNVVFLTFGGESIERIYFLLTAILLIAVTLALNDLRNQ
jgi:hypothetical protein